MAVIPSFGAFAQTPNTAQSYLSGAKLAIDQQSDQQRLAAQVAQHTQTIALERQRLQQQAQMAEMELAAKSASQAREEMVRQQQNEIENQYKQQMIGLKNRELEQAQQKLQMEAEQASRTFAAQQEYTQLVASGKTPEEAIGLIGPKLGAPSGFYSSTGRSSDQAFIPTETTVGGNKLTQVSPKRWAFSPTAPGTGVYEESPEPGYFKYNNRLMPKREDPEVIRQRADLKDFLKENESLMPYISGARPAPQSQQTNVANLKRQYDELKATIPASVSRQSSTNRIGRFNVISNAPLSN